MAIASANNSLANSLAYSAGTPERLRLALTGLSEREAEALLYDWRGFWARPSQLPPGSAGAALSRIDWRYWLVQAGRGFGKTRVGAESVRQAVYDGRKLIALIGATSSDVRKVMVEHPDGGLLSCFPPAERAKIDYQPSRLEVHFWTGATAYMYSAEEPNRLRGPKHDFGWGDEVAAWKYPEALDQFFFGLRVGDDPRAVFTTTPKPVKILRDLIADTNTVVTRASSYENRSNLAPAFFDSIIRKYEGTRLGRQELLAELLEDIPGALWTRDMIERSRIQESDIKWDRIIRTVIAIDPAVSNTAESDETGIVVAALLASHHVLVLEDLTCRDSPGGWAKRVVGAFKRWKADRIVAERNNGGDLVERNIRIENPSVPITTVWAKRGKQLRAEPVSALYEQNRVHHVGALSKLEDQLCEWVPGDGQSSPDRMDALVYALIELVVDPAPQGFHGVLAEPANISPI